MTRIAFIGGGNMARSLIAGLIEREQPADRISVAEPVAELRSSLATDFGVRVLSDNAQAVDAADLVVLAVKPQVMGAVCRQLAPALHGRSVLVVSIAAGIRIADCQRWLGADCALLRAMPNTPALIGEGITGLCAGPGLDSRQRALAERVLGGVGAVCWIEDEALMDAVTAVSGSGPAYFFLLMEALVAAAIAQGLPPKSAHELVVQTALGAARMARNSDAPPELLRQRVTSPNGTTAAALAVLQTAGFADIVAAAVARATERGRELSEQVGD